MKELNKIAASSWMLGQHVPSARFPRGFPLRICYKHYCNNPVPRLRPLPGNQHPLVATTCYRTEHGAESRDRGLAPKAQRADSSTSYSPHTGTVTSCVTCHRKAFPRFGLVDTQRPVASLQLFHIFLKRWQCRELQRMHFCLDWSEEKREMIYRHCFSPSLYKSPLGRSNWTTMDWKDNDTWLTSSECWTLSGGLNRDFMLPPRCWWHLRSSGILCGVVW